MTTDNKRRQSDQISLDSWKAIANYLNRSVRTVRRWEARENLPVHRHQHTKGFSVYAYANELDAWKNSQRQPRQSELGISGGTRKIPLLAAAVSVVAIALVVVFGSSLIDRTLFQGVLKGVAPNSTRDAWVLIATPVNFSGQPNVDPSLLEALRREISATSNHRELPMQRVQDALRLMRKEPDTVLSPAIAREVAIRDGQVDALLIPHLEQSGNSFVLSLELREPDGDLLIAYPSEKIDTLDSRDPAIRRLARRVARAFPELAINPPAEHYARVTTSSLSALKHYSQASRLLNDDRPRAAHELLQLAIEEDTEFASARTLQAWALRRAGENPDSYRPLSQAAVTFNGQVSDQERYFIVGSYLQFSGDEIRANANYRALLEIQPDHVFGAYAVLDLCSESQSMGDCVQETVQFANLRPDHFGSNLQAAWVLAAQSGTKQSAMYFANRSLQIMRRGPGPFPADDAVRALILPFVVAWTDRDVQLALRNSREVLDELPNLPVETQSIVIRHLLDFSLALGRIEDARNLLELVRDPAQRYALEATILFASGQKGDLRNHLASAVRNEEPVTALFMTLSGLAMDNASLESDSQFSSMTNAQRSVIYGLRALMDGQPELAKNQLQVAVSQLGAEDEGYYFVAPETLSNIFNTEGNLLQAINVLEQTMPRQFEAVLNKSGVYWLMCQRQLANLYREAGREQDATQVEDELRKMLILADHDFPLVRSLSGA